MVPEITEFNNYRAFLTTWIARAPRGGRGQRSAMARAARCQPSYLSQVLSGAVHLSGEQAEGIARFLGLADWETEYLVMLVEWERASTLGLKRIFEGRLEQIRQSARRFKGQIPEKAPLTEGQKGRYYSAWYFGAIHILLTIPGKRTVEAVAQYLQLPAPVVSEALNFLVGVGLVRVEGDEYRVTQKRIHLDDDSPYIVSWHSQWRQQALNRLVESGSSRLDQDLHYSSVVTIARNDAQTIRQELMRAISRFNERVEPSPAEVLYGFCLDFFEV